MALTEVASPKASRQSLPRWLDPKLILGVLFVAASMVLGAQVISRADQTTEVWAVRADLTEGESIIPDEHLEPKRVRFTSSEDAQRYLTASKPIAEGARMTRAVGAGELLPKNAVTTDKDEELRDFPIEVIAGRAPDLSTGDMIDVYAVNDDPSAGGGDGEQGAAAGQLVLSGVRIVEISNDGGLTGGGGSRVTVRLDREKFDDDAIANAAATLATSSAYIVRHTTP